MTQGGFFEQKRSSPTSLAIVIAIHGAAITALAMSKMEVIDIKKFTPLEIRAIKDKPPPEPVEPQPETPAPPSTILVEKPLVDLPTLTDVVDLDTSSEVVPIAPTDGPALPNINPVIPYTPPKPAPVRVDAQFDPRFADRLQPPYPPAEQRAEVEGKVTVRVLIGADGRVKQVFKLSAPSDAFFRVTQRQALGQWRFKPATLDGRPVESEKVLTVVFEIE